ncbi:MAG TPA: chromosomal replication initiator protein DnaA [Desulfatiglandales bacterium]|nr:chromosomal replication initiator protein DnaA [Desulfatiglandales bacterium]
MSSRWEKVKSHIRERLPENSFSLWINPITLLDESEDALVLSCPNKFSMNWIMDNYIGIMEEELGSMGNKNYKIMLEVRPPEKREVAPSPLQQSRQLILPNLGTNRMNGGRTFNKEFTFDRFVVGSCNEFAYSASKALAMGETWSYDSLYILANTGLGKSHLSQSIGHSILENNPDIRAYYITAEDFVNEMVFAIKNNRTEEFKKRYRRSCDVLILEEVHFLSGKEKTQQELGHTLDILANDGKKIIFTSVLLPKDIPNMSKELSSRLTSGIITTLEGPDYDTRIKIIEKKSSEQNLCLPDDIKQLFAKNLTRDIRQIESAIRCLRAKSELLKAKIDLSLAKEVIRCHVVDQNQVSIEGIKKIICQYFKVDPSALQSKSRKMIYSYPRNMYVYLCRNYSSATLEEIGSSVNRNHSTIVYSSEVIERKIRLDNRIKNQVNFLKEKIKEMTH